MTPGASPPRPVAALCEFHLGQIRRLDWKGRPFHRGYRKRPRRLLNRLRPLRFLSYRRVAWRLRLSGLTSHCSTPCIRPDETFDKRKTPAQHRASALGCQAGVPMKLRFAPGNITERNLGLCAQLPMPSGRQLGILRWRHAINHPPAWLTTIFIWDRCRAPSSALGGSAAADRGFAATPLRGGATTKMRKLRRISWGTNLSSSKQATQAKSRRPLML